MEYDKISFFGEAIIDKVKLENRILTNQQIEDLQFSDYLTWDQYTIMMSEFNNTLSAGNIVGMTNPPTKWEIYRKIEGDTVYTKIAELDMGNLNFYDYTAPLQEECKYRIYAVNELERSSELETEEVVVDFHNWTLISPEEDIVYIFDANIESGEVSTVDDVNIEHNLKRKFPTVTFGDREYTVGSLRAYVGNITLDNERVYSASFLDDLKKFINNKKTKILKSPNGDVWKVVTHNFNYKYYDEVFHHATRTKPAQIFFEFAEVSEDFMRYA